MVTEAFSKPIHFEPLQVIRSFEAARAVVSRTLIEYARTVTPPVSILEAGCGRKWSVDMGDIPKRITGVI